MKQPLLILTFLLLAGNSTVLTQTTKPLESTQIPTVIQLGNYEDQYAEIIQQYPANLLAVCNDSMELAYEHWMRLMLDMELYSEEIGFDLKGIKIWINIFWNKNGNIDYISYYPKPNCRNIPFEQLTVFFQGFIESYETGKSTPSNFSHYGSASFPSFAQMFLHPEK